MKDYVIRLVQHFEINDTSAYYPIICPYHEDSRPSAGINISKNHFHCFVCGDKNLKDLYRDIFDEKPMSKEKPSLSFDFDKIMKEASKPQISEEQILTYLKQLIDEKGLTYDILKKLNAIPVTDPNHFLYGYLGIPVGGDKFVARKFIPEVVGPKWYNSNGEKPLLIFDPNSPDIILVEGIWDAVSLMNLGYNNVACNLGTDFNKRRAFSLKGKIVYILFDNDFAGYEGAEKAYDALRRVKAFPVILELPLEFVHNLPEKERDLNNAAKHKGFAPWLKKNLTQVETSDISYLEQMEDDLIVYSSGIPTWDNFLQGGYRPGVHVIAGEPGTGKSALLLWWARYWVETTQAKVLYNTYEISKRQSWARITTQFDEENTWVDIETGKDPTPKAKEKTRQIAQRLKIMAGTDISEIVRASRFYDIIIIDYIQRMPGDTDSEKYNIGKNIRALSDLARDKGKIIMIASSIPRTGYGKEELNIFKESGDIEFVVQSAAKLVDKNHTGIGRVLALVMLKNTRGAINVTAWIEGNMLHNTFRDTMIDDIIGDTEHKRAKLEVKSPWSKD